jgi:aryl-alcohol dehydrogenase-like predicted oxidoreductase
MSEEDVFEILEFIKSQDIQFLDTAAAYGTSEKRIGNYLEQQTPNCPFKIITKLDVKSVQSPVDSLKQSLFNLKVQQVDTIMFHSYDDFQNTKRVELDRLLDLKGISYQKLGISLYTNEQIEKVFEMDIFDVVQIPFNCLDNQNLRGLSLKLLKSKKIEVHTRSVFLQGLFFKERSSITGNLKPLVKYLNQLDEIAKKHQIDLAALALHYSLSKPNIDGVLIGVDSILQLKQNIDLLNVTVPESVFSEVDGVKVNEINLLNPATWNS